jgi:hypothetical protein
VFLGAGASPATVLQSMYMQEITRRSSTQCALGWFLVKCGSIDAHWIFQSQHKCAIHAFNALIEHRESYLPLQINALIGLEP